MANKKKLNINGVCTCGNDLWHWNISENTLTLVCSKCGEEAHFDVMFPMVDILSDALGLTNK